MAYKQISLPTCKKCGHQHFNYTKCTDTGAIELQVRAHTPPKPPVWIEGTTPFNRQWNKGASGGTLQFSSLPMKERGSVTPAGGE
jgi:hypothetical protein